MIRAGKLDRYIELQSLTTTQDASGHPVKSWPPLAKVWASKRVLRGEEKIQNLQKFAQTFSVFRIRWRSDVNPVKRLVDLSDGRVYDILDVAEVGRREGLDITAKARAE